MEKRPCWLHAVQPVRAVTAGRVGCALGCTLVLAACSGIEADVLSLRPVLDMAVAATDGPAPDRGAQPQCTTQTISAQSCVEVPLWLMKAQSVCWSLGLQTLGRVEPQEPCGLGKSQGIRFECCPPPPVPVCTPRLQGDDTSCRDANTWLDSATIDCQARREQVRMLALSEPCSAHGFRLVKYMCCTPGVSPGPMLPALPLD